MIIKHRSPEWYKARIGKFTASNFGVLMSKAADGSDGWSKSAMDCINDLARQLYENEYHERPDNDATRWGINHEAKAIQEFSRASGLEVADAGFVLHPDFPDVGATPDAIVIDKSQSGKLILAQIKCPYCSQNHLNYTRKIKDSTTLRQSKLHYYLQMQGEMWVTGASHSYFVSYDPRLSGENRMHYVKIERDEEAIEQLRKVILKAIILRNEILSKFQNKKKDKEIVETRMSFRLELSFRAKYYDLIEVIEGNHSRVIVMTLNEISIPEIRTQDLTYEEYLQNKRKLEGLGYTERELYSSVEAGEFTGCFLSQQVKRDNAKIESRIFELTPFISKFKNSKEETLVYFNSIWVDLIHSISGKKYEVKILATREIIKLANDTIDRPSRFEFEAICDKKHTQYTRVRLKSYKSII